MERQSTSKLYRALIAVVAFFVLCTSAILFASCGTNPLECEHTYGPGDVKEVRVADCGNDGTVTYECSKCGALVTVTVTLATGEHEIVNGRCKKCGATGTEGSLTLADLKADLTSILTALNTVAGKADVDKVASSVVEALKNPDTTIPNLWKLLTDIRDNIAELDFGDIEIIDDGETTTLGAVIASLYKQVNKLYVDLTDEGKNTDGLYDLLVGVGGTGTQEHVHNWVLELKDPDSYSCTEPNIYVWGCSFCTATKGEEVTVMATGHATEFETGKTAAGHHYDATCISPARVEGYCHNCGEWTGEWTTQGQPTYQHHYVLETGTDADGETGAKGSCTSVHKNVYHCETCGGAYVEETTGSSNGQHNYYYVANEDGTNKQPMEDKDKIAVWNKAHPDDTITDLSELTVSEEQELNELLKEGRLEDGRVYALNVVYYSAPNCVDPALIVVECMECGVRYAYTFGQPDGHHFILVHEEDAATCTMDGVKEYFYCDHCGYFFFLDGINNGDLVEISTGTFAGHKEFPATANLGSKEYTRNYMTDLDGKVINDKTNKALENQAAYDVATDGAPALGHDYVVVYTNNRKCVTAQDYILVCQRKGCLAHDGTTEFSSLVKVEGETKATDSTALFYQAVKNGPYFLKGLTGDNTKSVLDVLLATVNETADDTADTTSDLTKEWEAIKDGERADVFIWLAEHGYLVRDSLDDEVFGSISIDDTKKWYDAETGKLTDDAKTAIDEYLAKLDALQEGEYDGEYDLAKLYNGYSKAETGTTTKTKVASNVLVGFELPVTGHAFNDYFVTVVGGCTLYERHVRFCAVCGQYTATPSETTGVWPYVVSGDTDASLLKGGDNDLEASWKAVLEAAEKADPLESPMMVINWLAKYGYLNDYRDCAVTTPIDGQEMYRIGTRVMDIIGAKDEEDDDFDALEYLTGFYGKNVLPEFKVDVKFGKRDTMEDEELPVYVADDKPVVLGHTFDAVTLLSEEVCDAPGRYVYVCSKCGDPLNTSKGTLKYMSGSATVDTGLKLVEDPIFKSEEYILKASAQASRLAQATDKLDKSDLQRLYEDVENVGDNMFDWLLEHGYLNNVIDTYYTVGYTDAQKALHGGWLADNIKKAGDDTNAIEGSIQEWYNTARANFYDENGALKEAAVTEHKEYLKALALKLLDGENPDITDYYEKSSNTYRTNPEDPKTEVKDLPANKTIDDAATEVPMSGHLYAYEDGTRINLSENGDGICTDFRSKEVLEKYYAKNVMIYWVEPALVNGAFKANPNYDKNSDDVKKWAPYATADGKPAGWVVLTDKEGNPVEFDPADLDPDFVAQVAEFGIVGACMRENCPYHTKYDKAAHTYDKKDAKANGFTAGYLAATDHVKVYEKYAVDGNTKLPIESRVDTIGGKKVYYNYKKVEEYMVVESAKYFAEGVGGTGTNYERWTAIASKAGLDKTDETRTDETEKANYKILYDAATAARNDDLHNLYTLQWIWNTLFVPADWLTPEDKDTAATRQAMYPTLPIKDETGKVLTTMRKQVLRLQTLFQQAGVRYLWREIEGRPGEYVSAWRPLTDSFMPSCWVSLRCKWYRSTSDHKCTYIDPTVNHDWPYYGEFDYDTHAANCKHPDLCNTCGKEMGRFGDHKLIQVDPGKDNALNSQSMKAAWIEVLKHYKEIDWLKDIIWVDEANLSVNNWSTCWKILADTCYEGETVEGVANVGKEDGHKIYVCSGELEVIYNEIVNPIEQAAQTWEQVVGEGLDVEWDVASAADAKDGNYFVATIDNEKHNFVTRYYALRDFKLNGVEYKKDQLLAANEDEWNEKFAFSEFVCQGGYYTLDVCTHIKRDTAHIAEGEGACKPGCEHECGKVEEGSRRDYPAAGHFLAPVENYWTYAERYTPASAEHNASMIQVCVICGVRTQSREYGVTDDGQDHEQYNIATKTMIDRWNEHVEAYNKKVDESLGDLEEGEDPVYLYKAQLPLSKDLKGTSSSGEFEAGGKIFGDGLNVYQESANLTLKGQGVVGETFDSEATVLVAEGKELSFTGTSSDLKLHGTVNFVGEGEGATVDFSALGGMLKDSNSIHLVFENMTVIMNDESTSGDTRIAVDYRGSTYTFKNSTIISKTIPFGFNATKNLSGNKIFIEDSVFISTDGEGFAIWDPELTVEASNSAFFGKNAGAFIRAGKATFEDCEFYTEAGQKGDAWGDGSDTNVSAGIIIGNCEDKKATDYGNAEVVLHGCKFGTTTAANMENWGTEAFTAEACTAADPAIAAFSSSLNETKVTLDKASLLNADKIAPTPGFKMVEGEKVSTLKMIYPETIAATDLGKTAGEQAQNAAKLVESLVGAGGEIKLPKVDKTGTVDTVIDLTGSVDVAEGVETTVDLGGNVVQLAEGSTSNHVVGSLKLTNGTVTGGMDDARFSDFEVTGSLELDGITATFDKGGIAAFGANAQIVIKNSHIIGGTQVIATNNAKTQGKSITIENSTVIATAKYGCALLVNQAGVTVTAKNTTFFGIDTAVWVRAGVATFDGCTFVSGGWRVGDTAWGEGAQMKNLAYAALAVGEGEGMDYGDATVTVTGDTKVVRGWNNSLDKTYAPDSDNTVAWTDAGEITYVKNNGEAQANALSKRFTVATNTHNVTVTFGSKAIADLFMAPTDIFVGKAATAETKYTVAGLVEGETEFGDLSKITVRYRDGGTDTAPEYKPVGAGALTLAKSEVASKAPDALKNAAENGGKIELPAPAKAADAKTVTIDAAVLQTPEAKEGDDPVKLEVNLNGNNLTINGDGEHSDILANKGTEIVIDGGNGVLDLKGTKGANGADGIGSKLTIKNTVVKTASAIQGQNGAVIVLENTTVLSKAKYGVSTNNTLASPDVTYTITNSKIASYETGNIGLLINNDKVTLNATDSEFYGLCTGAWVRSGVANFTNCTFISGSSFTGGATWGSGTKCPDAAKAALLVGDGEGVYGNATVTLNAGCKAICSFEYDATSSNVDAAIDSSEKSYVKFDATKNWFEFTPYTGTAQHKQFVVAEGGDQKASVNFADATVAAAFGINSAADLIKADTDTKTQNVFVIGTGALEISVKIGTADPTVFKAEA